MISFTNATSVKSFLNQPMIFMNMSIKNTQEHFVKVVNFSSIAIFTLYILANVNIYLIAILVKIEYEII
jgi:hypothetical protein